MSRGSVIVIAIVVLLAAASLAFTDSFYAALDARPEDAGVSSVEVVVRGIAYLALPVGLAVLLTVAMLVLLRGVFSRLRAGRPVVAWAASIVGAAVLTMLVSVLFVPGLGRFVEDSSHLAGCAIVALALAGMVALARLPDQERGAPSKTVLAALTLLTIGAAAASSVTLASSAARDLAHRAASPDCA